MMDLDALREAVEWWDEHKGFLWQRLHDDDWARVDRSFAAARAVLDSEEAWRCEAHDSPTGDKKIDAASRCFLVIENGGGFAYPCVFEPVAVVRRRLLAEEGT